MPALTRRRSLDAPDECWRVCYGDVRVGTIAIRTGTILSWWIIVDRALPHEESTFQLRVSTSESDPSRTWADDGRMSAVGAKVFTPVRAASERKAEGEQHGSARIG